MNAPGGTPAACSDGDRRHAPAHWAALGLGILAVSAASVLIRLAEAPALVVGAGRMAFATLLLTPWGLASARREWPALTRRDWALLGLAGVALAAHFGTWIASLGYTGVASSVVLVSTNPVWVALAARRLTGRPVGRGMIPAIAVVMAGGAIVAWGDAGAGLTARALWGDLLALLGAVSMSAYILLGRAVRRKLSTIAYVWPCYGIAAIILLALCLLTGQPLHGYTGRTVLILFLLAVGPQIIGHSTFNWALARFSPVLVTLAILGEPVGATVLAAALLRERPTAAALAGAAVILAGLYLGSVAERRRVPSRNETLTAEPSHTQAMPAPGNHSDKERGP